MGQKLGNGEQSHDAWSNSVVKEKISHSDDKSQIIQKDEKPPYYEPVRLGKYPGMTASLDMVRMRIETYDDGGYEILIGSLDKVPSDKTFYYRAEGAHKYTNLWTFEFGGESVTVGLGFNKPGSKIDKTTGFVEFNPNKLGGKKAFYKLWQHLEKGVRRYELVRFDVAIDIEQKRECFQLLRDRRRYEYTSDKSITEYLGRKSHEGRVKLYDKQAEADLKNPLTRIELTCGDRDSFGRAIANWPKILALKPNHHPGKENYTTAMLLRLQELGEPVQRFLDMMEAHTRANYKKKLAKYGTVEFPNELFTAVYKQALDWERLQCIPPKIQE